MNERIAAVIVAAGHSTRFGAPKILTPIGGIPAIVHTIRAFQGTSTWSSMVLVVNPAVRSDVSTLLAGSSGGSAITLVDGGERRQDSVAAGMEAAGDMDIVVVHDGARPLVTPRLIKDTIDAVRAGADAAVAAIPVTDTLKRRTSAGVESVDRKDLWRAQTPQAFRAGILRSALSAASRNGRTVTDESMAVESIGGRVALVPGDPENLKLTTPEDAQVAEALLGVRSGGSRNGIRTGIGYDVHRLVPGRPLVLGGVEIQHRFGLEGHSDADVVLHAIADAVLGACSLGDIGHHFPPSDDAFRGVSSMTLLERVAEIVTAHNFAVVNVDATVIAEEPRIAPFVAQMQASISSALGTHPSSVSVKATTNEGLGFAGRGEGIAAMAVATVQALG